MKHAESFSVLLSQGVYTCFFILSECPAFTAVRWYIGHTSAFISRIFVEIDMLLFFHIFCNDA